MKYRFFAFLMIFLLTVSNIYGAENDIKLYVNDKRIKCDVAPVIVNDRTLVPARALFESLGAECTWEAETREVEISMEETTILLTINSLVAYVNEEETMLDVSPIIINSRTMLPVRFISETLGYDVKWIAEDRTVDVKSADYARFIKEFSTSSKGDEFTLKIDLGSEISDYKIYPLESPKRLVLELEDFNYMTPEAIEVGKRNIQQIRMANHPGLFKIVFDLSMFSPYKVNVSKDKKSIDVVLTYAGDDSIDASPTPSVKPSATPSTKPSSEPSSKPSATPSVKPSATPSPAPTPVPGKYFSENPLVVIDAGHGGTDGGTHYADKDGNIIIKEKDINLDIANKTVAFLEKAGVKVESTRTTDVALPLKGRSEFANSLNAELFVSIHVNSFTTPDANGSLTLYSSKKDEIYSDKIPSKTVAEEIQKRLYKAFGTKDSGTRSEDDLSVLRNTTMPAVLIETAFLSNSFDREILSDDDKRTAAAKAIAEAIIEILQQ